MNIPKISQDSVSASHKQTRFAELVDQDLFMRQESLIFHYFIIDSIDFLLWKKSFINIWQISIKKLMFLFV